MNRNLDDLIADALDVVARDAPDLGPLPQRAMTGAESVRTWRWLATASVAAVTIGIIVAGLMALSPSVDEPDPVQSPTESTVESTMTSLPAAQLPIPDLAALTAGRWLVATDLPDGYEMTRAWSTFDDRTAVYEHPDGEQVVVSTVATADADGAPPAVDAWVLPTDGPVSAAYRGGGWSIDVDATALTAAELRRIVAGLTVVSEETLPVNVLDTTSVGEEGAVVASADIDGVVEELRVSGGAGAYCLEGPSGGSCPVMFDPIDVIAPAGGGLLDAEAGALRGRVRSMGVAAPEVASVRFELMDGQTIDVVPTDLSGSFDVKFWLMASWIDLASPAPNGDEGPVATSAPIVGITAFDADGNVLAGPEITGS